MRKIIICLTLLLATVPCIRAQLTLDRCLTLAEKNYPLISNYDIVSRTADINLSDINRGWLPAIMIGAQATAQNVVPEFPESLSGVLSQMGAAPKGMGKLQYRASVDVQQPVWDGGESAARRRTERAAEAENRAELDVRMYEVREKVENIFFGILLTDSRVARMEQTLRQLEANHDRLKAMFTDGVAMRSDVDMIEAQILKLRQQIIEARGASRSYRDVLAIYIGVPVNDEPLVRPTITIPADTTVHRPELQLFDSRINRIEALGRMTDVSLRPRISFFAQAYYGYPGFNYFKSIMKRDISLNAMAGVKLTWNISAFYTASSRRRSTSLSRSRVETERDIFLFGIRLLRASQSQSIRTLQQVTADDTRIIELYANVRKAAEVRLENGVIDVTDLITKIADENTARLDASYHEIRLLQEICNLNHTLNR